MRRISVRQESPGALVVVPAGTGTIVVLNYALSMSADGELMFKSSGGTEHGAFDISATGGLVCPDSEKGWLATEPGEGLVIETSGGLAKGHLTYVREV